jgi:hypothetical protein
MPRQALDANTKSIVRVFHEKMDACVASRRDDREVTMSCQEKMEPNSEEKEAVVERQNISKEEVAIHSLRACRSETADSQEATEANTEKTEPDRGIIQSVAEHQEAPKEDAAVKPVKGRKKRHRGRKPAAERRGEPKELTRSDCGSGNNFAAACRKVSSCVTVALHRKNAVRRTGTQDICGPLSKLTAA